MPTVPGSPPPAPPAPPAPVQPGAKPLTISIAKQRLRTAPKKGVTLALKAGTVTKTLTLK